VLRPLLKPGEIAAGLAGVRPSPRACYDVRPELAVDVLITGEATNKRVGARARHRVRADEVGYYARAFAFMSFRPGQEMTKGDQLAIPYSEQVE